jgi:hypothetical protein
MLKTQKKSNLEVCTTKILLCPSPLVMDRIYFIHGTNVNTVVNTVVKAAGLKVVCVDILAIFSPNFTIQLEAQ